MPGRVALSVQVLQEFFVTTTRKIPKPLDAPAAARIIGDLAHWHVHTPAVSDVVAAIEIHQRTGASFWDAMILRSAKELGCQILHSEDLNAGQEYDGVRGPQPVPGLVRTLTASLDPSVPGTLPLGRLEVALGRKPGPFGTMTGGDRCGRITVDGT